jgi:tRNA uridine 5-carbamoylmethylation protein Kti12
MSEKINILISGPACTGKSVLAKKIKRFLEKEGYANVSTDGTEVTWLPIPAANFLEKEICISTTNETWGNDEN